jgi:hypothetical protein
LANWIRPRVSFASIAYTQLALDGSPVPPEERPLLEHADDLQQTG